MRSWRGCLVVSLVACPVASLVVGGGPAAAASAEPARAGAVASGFQLVNLHSRKCLTVTAAGLADDAILIQKACTREAAARWRFVRAGRAGMYQILNVNSGKCLGIAGDSVEDNGFAVQARCDGGPSRLWSIRKAAVGLLPSAAGALPSAAGALPNPAAALPVPGGVALLENGRSRRCLTIAGGSDAENGVAVQYTCDAEASRRWSLRLVAGPALEGRYRPLA